MRYGEGDLLGLIDAAYAGAADRDAWPGFLARITATLGGMSTIYRWSRDAPFDNRPLFDNFGDHGRAYEAHYRHCNVWVTDAPASDRRIVPSELTTPIAALERTEFYNDWLRPQGLKHGVSCSLTDQNGLAFNLGIIRTPSRGAFDHDELQLLAAAMPHVTRALELSATLDRLESQAGGTLDALGALGLGALTVDAAHRVVLANAQADRILAVTPGLRLHSGRIGALREAVDVPLRRAIAAATGEGRRLSGRVGTLVAVPRPDAPPLTISVFPLQDRDRPGAGHEPLALLVIGDPLRQNPGDAHVLAALYGLTPAEAALAAALTGGDTLAGYARQAGVALPTVKTQLSAIFAKVGVNRQADLVRTLTANPALAAH